MKRRNDVSNNIFFTPLSVYIGKKSCVAFARRSRVSFSRASGPEPSRFVISLRVLDRNGGMANLTNEEVGTIYISLGFLVRF